MRKSPKISVVTPVYNGEKYIEETILSVLSAIGDRNIEYLVVNDGSFDGTSQILSTFKNQVRILTQSNLGESEAVNAGLINALGDIVLVVSADDPLFTSRIFDHVEEKFESDPKLVAWYCNWQMIDHRGEIIRVVEVEEFSVTRLIEDFICIPGPGTFFRKSSALIIGGRHSKWKFVADYDFWLRISQVGNLEKRPEVLAQWRNHSDSTSISLRGKEMAQERIGVISEFIVEFDFPPDVFRRALGQAYFSAACLIFFSKQVPGKKYLIHSILLRPNLLQIQNSLKIGFIILSPVSRSLYRFYKYILKLNERNDD
jgi:glycosyltransferase involved in cell wall biosynthesis